MKQKSNLLLIYKLHSKLLKQHKWNLTLPLEEASRSYPDSIVALSDSQVMRWISELNGITDRDEKINEIKRRIAAIKKKPRSRENSVIIKQLHSRLQELQFQKDYLCVIMDSKKDYDKANQGFVVNGIKFRRFLGTNGGIKNSTIVYVNEELYPELKKRLDNGRKMDVPLVPAKLEAYQALVCSGSTPLPEPKGFIVVKDCVTFFKEDVILVDDSCDGEPKLTYVDDYEVEHDDSDGYGLMLPSYSRRVNEFANGTEGTISGLCCRNSWTKGMVFTFDFVEFAEKVSGTYEVTDVWGHKRDVRDAEVILTESMLKLWNCYDSWEDYWANCQNNHYQFSATKTTPTELEHCRYTNYQFLQGYDFSDEDIEELCSRGVSELKDICCLDWRKSALFLAASFVNDWHWTEEDKIESYIKALLIDDRVIKDPFIRKTIYRFIKGKIDMGKRGAVKVNGNYAMISGDPYSLCQSMFGLEVTGLLNAGEIYHAYWMNKGAEEISCFRAPMTILANVVRLGVCKRDDAKHWYQHMDCVAILNSWDTTNVKMNGCDADGDTMMCTDNPVIVKNTPKQRALVCLQRKANKKVPSEQDIIEANKLAFNDDIGTITNFVTSMFEVQAGFEKGSKEYETLGYRTMCGQSYQQASIDRAKGIIAKPMPEYWHSVRDNIPKDDDDEETIATKKFNMSISANRKPYFFIYIYPALMTRYRNYIRNCGIKCYARFYSYGIKTIDDLYSFEEKTDEMNEFIYNYEKKMPVGKNPCVVNRISYLFERAFEGLKQKIKVEKNFDYSIYKSGANYSKVAYQSVQCEYRFYRSMVKNFMIEASEKHVDDIEREKEYNLMTSYFKQKCEEACTNEYELCDILIDMLYGSDGSKNFVWDICGETIVKNLFRNCGNKIRYIEKAQDAGEFEYDGEQYVVKWRELSEEEIDSIK